MLSHRITPGRTYRPMVSRQSWNLDQWHEGDWSKADLGVRRKNLKLKQSHLLRCAIGPISNLTYSAKNWKGWRILKDTGTRDRDKRRLRSLRSRRRGWFLRLSKRYLRRLYPYEFSNCHPDGPRSANSGRRCVYPCHRCHERHDSIFRSRVASLPTATIRSPLLTSLLAWYRWKTGGNQRITLRHRSSRLQHPSKSVH